MSQDNVEIVMRLHAAFSRGDLEGLLGECQPDVTYRAAITQAVEGDAGDFRGHAGMRRWWLELHALYDDLHTEVVDVRDLGKQALVAFVIHGRARGSGLAFDGGQRLAQVATLRDGRIAEIRDYPSREAALEAVGLRE